MITQEIVVPVAGYVRSLTDMLVGYVEVDDKVGAVITLSYIYEAIAPGGSYLASAFLRGIAGTDEVEAIVRDNDLSDRPETHLRQRLRLTLAQIVGLPDADIEKIRGEVA